MNLIPKIPSPPGYDLAYAQSYALAFDRLVQSDLMQIYQRSGASLVSKTALKLNFLNLPVIVDIGKRTIEPLGNPLPITDKLVVLHYLVTAGGQSETGKLISFNDLPEGAGYFPTFYKRAIAPVVRKFGSSTRDLPIAAAPLGGVSVSLGDAAVSIEVFPHVTLNWIVWQGEGSLPPEGSIVFDSGVIDYLPVEDIAALCHSVALRLCS